MARMTRLLKNGHDWQIKMVTDWQYREFELAVCERCGVETPDWEEEPPCEPQADS